MEDTSSIKLWRKAFVVAALHPIRTATIAAHLLFAYVRGFARGLVDSLNHG